MNKDKVKIMKTGLSVFGVVAIVLFAWAFKNKQHEIGEITHAANEQLAQAAADGAPEAIVNDISVPAQKSPAIFEGMSRSEHYGLREVIVGGYEASQSNESPGMTLAIDDVRSDVFVTRDGKNAEFLVYWKTNKLAKSELTYAKNGGAKKTIAEGGPGYSHALVISQADFQTRYTYEISAQDRFGNKVQTKTFALYTHSKEGSVVDLITGEFKGLFKWAIK